MKKLAALFMAFAILAAFSACGKNNNVTEPTDAFENETMNVTSDTLGNVLLEYFNDNSEKTISDIAQGISELDIITFKCMTSPVEEGFLSGFTENITGFNEAVTFAPIIGSIPFVGYVFEADDTDALVTQLKDNADLRWNICVQADEMIVSKSGSKVFFVMCPKDLEEE